MLESIRRYGIQVPISVYRQGKKYILIDGERRWRCSIKLNRKTIPALVQDEPSPLANLLLMFNIHGLREQWDLLVRARALDATVWLAAVDAAAPDPQADPELPTPAPTGVGHSALIAPDGTVLYKLVGQVDAAGLNKLLREVRR